MPFSKHAALLRGIAQRSIEQGLDGRGPLSADEIDLGGLPGSLSQRRATFTTLMLDGRLRGCMGSLEARNPLAVDVAGSAYGAAFNDSRFSRLDRQEYPRIQLHISILTPPEPISFTDEEELLSLMRPGLDGIVLRAPGHSATYLPSVWESLPEPADFLGELKLKAGLERAYWSAEMEVLRYGVEEI